MRKLCLSTKFPYQEIRWNYCILCSVLLLEIIFYFSCKHFLAHHLLKKMQNSVKKLAYPIYLTGICCWYCSWECPCQYSNVNSCLAICCSKSTNRNVNNFCCYDFCALKETWNASKMDFCFTADFLKYWNKKQKPVNVCFKGITLEGLVL